MRRIKQATPSPALLVAVVALVAALGGGAVAGVAVNSLSKKERKKVGEIARKQARKLDRRIELLPGPKGEQGEQGQQGEQGGQGQQGPPGPSTGPAGGALTGDYPNPTLAPGSVGSPELANEAVTAAAVGPNSLGGDQINESSLVGFDQSAGSFNFSIGQGGAVGFGNAGGLLLKSRCTGSAGSVGIEVEIENNSGFTRTVYANALTDGGGAQVKRTSIANGDTATVIDIDDAVEDNLHHWLTLLIPQSTFQTHQIVVRTRADATDRCEGNGFKTISSG